MDDDGSRTLNFEEFQKGLHDYGVVVSDQVSQSLSSFYGDVMMWHCAFH